MAPDPVHGSYDVARRFYEEDFAAWVVECNRISADRMERAKKL